MTGQPVTAADVASVPEKWAAAWASGDMGQLVALYAPAAVYRHPMFPEMVGREALLAHYEGLAASFRDFNPRVVNVVVDGDRVAAEIVHVAFQQADIETPTGTLPGTRTVESTAGHFFLVGADGLIAEEHQYG